MKRLASLYEVGRERRGLRRLEELLDRLTGLSTDLLELMATAVDLYEGLKRFERVFPVTRERLARRVRMAKPWAPRELVFEAIELAEELDLLPRLPDAPARG